MKVVCLLGSPRVNGGNSAAIQPVRTNRSTMMKVPRKSFRHSRVLLAGIQKRKLSTACTGIMENFHTNGMPGRRPKPLIQGMYAMKKRVDDKGSIEQTAGRTDRKIPDAGELAGLKWSHKPSQKLTVKQRSFLKSMAHELKSSVRIGQEGATDAVIGEIRKQLLLHELIKVKWSGLSKEAGNKREQAEALAEKIGAHYVHLIGHSLILYRESEPEYLSPQRTKRIELPA